MVEVLVVLAPVVLVQVVVVLAAVLEALVASEVHQVEVAAHGVLNLALAQVHVVVEAGVVNRVPLAQVVHRRGE